MAVFNYNALDEGGHRQTGMLEADSPRLVRQWLRDQGLTPLNVAQARGAPGGRQPGGLFPLRISVRDLASITRQLATLLQAGLPVEEGLAVVSRQVHNDKIRSVLLALRTRVLEGRTLSDGLEEFSRVFPDVYRATVAAGEHSGHLHEVLNRLADHTEETYESRQRVILSLLYPLLLLVLSVTIIAGLMVYVVPGVIDVFIETGQSLPLLTRILIALSEFIGRYGPALLAMVLAAAAVSWFALKNPRIRRRVHRLLLQLPVVGRFSLGVNSARFAGTLSILSNSGVPLVEAMRIAGQVLSNQWLRQRVEGATQKVVEGGSLNLALQQAGHFTPMMIQMIASGEASGRLDAMLQRVARDQEREVQTLIRVGLGLLEPLMLVVMGVCVLFIVLAVLLPILNLNQLAG